MNEIDFTDRRLQAWCHDMAATTNEWFPYQHQTARDVYDYFTAHGVRFAWSDEDNDVTALGIGL